MTTIAKATGPIPRGTANCSRRAARQCVGHRPGGGRPRRRTRSRRSAWPESSGVLQRVARQVRAEYPLPDRGHQRYEIVTDKPWSANYYEGDYSSTVAVNADLKQQMSNLRGWSPTSPTGHHTEHRRKEERLVAGQGLQEHTLFCRTPQCLMAEGLADLALYAWSAEQGRGRFGRRPRAAGSTVSMPRRCRWRGRRWLTSGGRRPDVA